MITIRLITMDQPLYQQERDLRERVLLNPLGINMAKLQAEFPGFEERFEHFVAVKDHPEGLKVVACAVLLPPVAGGSKSETLGKVMQVATDPQLQLQGIGRRLMVAIEARALGELGLAGLFCHARGGAIPFYQSLGWSVVGDPFQEVGIEHRRMEHLNQPATSNTSEFNQSL